MGRQGDKTKKKVPNGIQDTMTSEVKEEIVEIPHIKSGSLFTCSNLFFLIFSVAMAVIVTSLIVKSVELQNETEKQDNIIKQMKLATEDSDKHWKEKVAKSATMVDTLKDNVQSLEKEKEDLMRQIKGLHNEKEKQDNIIKEMKLSTENSDKLWKEKVAQSATKADTLGDNVQSLEKEKKELMRQIKGLHNQVEVKDKHVSEYHETQLKLQKLLEKKEEELSSLKDNLEQNTANAESEKKSLKEQIESSEDQILKLNNDIDEQINSVKVMADDLALIHEEKVQLSAKVDDLRKENDKKSTDISEATKIIKALQTEKDELSNSMKAYEDTTKKESDALNKAKNQCQQKYEENNEILLTQINKLKESLEAEKIEKASLEIESEEKINALVNNHKKEVEILENVSQKDKSELKILSQERESLLQDIEKLTNEVENTKTLLQTGQKELSATKDDKDNCDKMVKSSTEKIAQLENVVEKWKKDYSSTETELVNVRSNLIENESIQIENAKTIEDLTLKLKSVTDENSKLKLSVNTLQKD